MQSRFGDCPQKLEKLESFLDQQCTHCRIVDPSNYSPSNFTQQSTIDGQKFNSSS